jgi:hypothetical protein
MPPLRFFLTCVSLALKGRYMIIGQCSKILWLMKSAAGINFSGKVTMLRIVPNFGGNPMLNLSRWVQVAVVGSVVTLALLASLGLSSRSTFGLETDVPLVMAPPPPAPAAPVSPRSDPLPPAAPVDAERPLLPPAAPVEIRTADQMPQLPSTGTGGYASQPGSGMYGYALFVLIGLAAGWVTSSVFDRLFASRI